MPGLIESAERYFEFAALRTNWRTECLAGVTTFMTMAYIIFVNPSILHEAGMEAGLQIAPMLVPPSDMSFRPVIGPPGATRGVEAGCDFAIHAIAHARHGSDEHPGRSGQAPYPCPGTAPARRAAIGPCPNHVPHRSPQPSRRPCQRMTVMLADARQDTSGSASGYTKTGLIYCADPKASANR